MAQERVTRRIAAILVADVAGYSQMMERDELGSLAALKAHRRELIDGSIAKNEGRIVKLMGDGALVEFASVVDAVTCAAEIQTGMAARNAEVPVARRIAFRIGIHLGDIIVDGDDIYGDGVNVAARLEGLAEPGGICVSQQAFDQIASKLDLGFVDLGEQHVKNIARPVHVYRVDLSATAASATAAENLHQDIRFCTARDGTLIAYSTLGDGPPLVKTANWLNHLEYDLQSPVWRHLIHAFASDRRLVRYDARGNGLSDWNVDDISFEAFVSDLETVVDAAGLERFPLFGVSQGCAVSIAYAVRHPERVSGLVLYGGFVRGRTRRGSAIDAEREAALRTLMQHGWGQENPAFRQIFTSLFIPDASPQQMKSFNELQRMTTSPENAVRLRQAVDEIDVTQLAPQLRVPTLVLHCRDDAVQPFEEGRRMATAIPGARFVALEGRNHLILENEPAWPRFQAEVRQFLNA
jgi:class 3 adenylate cyclase/alpha-beta hydrolase superfamily lysophospholipase